MSRIVGVDIGDAGSEAHRAELGIRAKLMVLAYQLWLALAWRLGGGLGDRMARAMAGAMRCPAEPQPSAQRWLPLCDALVRREGWFRQGAGLRTAVPMLYLYGQRKPFMFHSQAWLEALARRSGSRVVGLRTGHWVMLDKPQDFNAEVARWLAETAPATIADVAPPAFISAMRCSAASLTRVSQNSVRSSARPAAASPWPARRARCLMWPSAGCGLRRQFGGHRQRMGHDVVAAGVHQALCGGLGRLESAAQQQLSSARAAPITRCSFCVPPAPGSRPMFTSGRPMR